MHNSFENLKAKLFSNSSTIPEQLIVSHFHGLDGLRGVSIIIVIVSHLFISTPYKPYFSGDAGVEIFFVLSGFLITSLLLKEKILTGKISLRKFYFRRLLRILPVAYLYLFVVCIINKPLELSISPISFFSSLIFIQNLPIKGFFNWYVAHFWSLSVEEQFYFTFPFLLAFNINKYIKVIIWLIIIVPIVSLLGYSKTGVFYTVKSIHIITFIIVNLFSKTVSILIGSLFSILLFKGIIQIRDTRFSRHISLPIFILAILLHTEKSVVSLPYCGLFIYPILIGIVIVLNLNSNSLMTKILNNSVLVYLGVLSYSLYIWQQLFASPKDSILGTESLIINILAIFLVANLSYFLYEKKILVIKNRLKI